jgi:hypothetical protein
MSNVCVKSNVFPREQVSIWRDKNFLDKISDARLLGRISDKFRENRPNENIRTFFSESQISIMRSPVTCAFAAGITTYGLVGEKRKLVCRCPYAAEAANRKRCGSAWDGCHELYEAPITVDLGLEPAVVVAQPAPEPGSQPPPPDEIEQEKTEPTQKSTVIEKPVVNEGPKEPSPKKTSEPEQQKQKDVLPPPKIAYPDVLSLSCCGYDIKGEKVRDGGYEIRISSGGVFVANINSFGIILGKHPKLVIEDTPDKGTSISFDNSEKMIIFLQQEPTPIVDITIGYTKISVCVK